MLNMPRYTFLDFFSGSGLVAEGLINHFDTVWANDVCSKKAQIYLANHSHEHFHLGSIGDINGEDVPASHLSWSSFPCVDLSLAGKMQGINASRSGLVWQWLRVLDEMKETPPILVIENVMGLLSLHGGTHYHAIHNALESRGYAVGPIVLNAIHWLPQSRSRVFIIAVNQKLDIGSLIIKEPNWAHPEPLLKAIRKLKQPVLWNLPQPPRRSLGLSDLMEFNAPCDDQAKTSKNLNLIPQHHIDKLNKSLQCGLKVAPGYKRIRNKRQVLELRFDDVAGCLRTPQGGSSRQYVVLPDNTSLKTRLLTVRETARLMGAPESYKLPGTYNQGYAAMGDAVAVPATSHLASNILVPLAEMVN